MRSVHLALLAVLSADPGGFTGQYIGSLRSSGQDSLARTTLELAPDQSLRGRYSFTDDDGGVVSGTLDACRVEGLTVTCRWSDLYGSGTLRMDFDASRCSFKGRWNTGAPSETSPYWNGSRNCGTSAAL